MPKKEDLEYLIESKSVQTKEASQILLSGLYCKVITVFLYYNLLEEFLGQV
jgi:hypothetical protein